MIYIGIDIAKRIHVASLENGKPFPFSNTLEGYRALAKWSDEVAEGQSICYLMEPTGHYYELLARHLTRAGHQVRLISGLNTRQAKQLFLSSRHKTDAVDARVLAKLGAYGQGNLYREREHTFDDARRVIDSYNHLVRSRTRIYNRMHRCLDILFPELPGLLSIRTQAAAELLLLAPTPNSILLVSPETARRSWPQIRVARFEAIRRAAQETAGIHSPALAEELMSLCRQLIVLSEQQADLERVAFRIVESVPYGPRLLTIPCVGLWTACAILGEVGDLRGYNSPRQVLKQAGLNLIEQSSGTHVSKARISRQGRRSLRGMLYQASLGIAREQNPFHPWYTRLAETGRPKKTIFVAACRKILKISWALARDNLPFSPERLLCSTPSL